MVEAPMMTKIPVRGSTILPLSQLVKRQLVTLATANKAIADHFGVAYCMPNLLLRMILGVVVSCCVVLFSSSVTQAQDTTPPTVTAVNPANGATGVARNREIFITFSEAMSASY